MIVVIIMQRYFAVDKDLNISDKEYIKFIDQYMNEMSNIIKDSILR